MPQISRIRWTMQDGPDGGCSACLNCSHGIKTRVSAVLKMPSMLRKSATKSSPTWPQTARSSHVSGKALRNRITSTNSRQTSWTGRTRTASAFPRSEPHTLRRNMTRPRPRIKSLPSARNSNGFEAFKPHSTLREAPSANR